MNRRAWLWFSTFSFALALCAVFPTPSPALAVGAWTQNPGTGHYYSLVSTVTWTVAERIAVQAGGHLVTVNDAAEASWLASTFPQPNLFTGLNDYAQEGTWVWSSGEPLSFTDWVEGEPNNYRGVDPAGENHVVMNWTAPEGEVGWNDWSDGVGPHGGVIEVDSLPAKTRAVLTRPSTLSSVRAGQSFTASTYLRPWHPSGARSVRFICYHLESGRWIRRASFQAVTSDFSTYSRASARLALSRRGTWRIRAYHDADWLHAASWSPNRDIRVR